MINLTESAVNKLNEMRPSDNTSLGLFAKGGGCGGILYHLEWLTLEEAGLPVMTTVFHKDKLNVVIPEKALKYLDNLVMDYDGGLNGSGFIYSNPNQSRGCGCGVSFTPKDE